MSRFQIYLYGPQQGSIPTSFEDAAERLRTLELLHFEPDGSFVWIQHSIEEQIYGMLYDADGMIQYAELQGVCGWNTWRRLIEAVVGEASANAIKLEIMILPDRELKNLQSFESQMWPTAANQSGQ